MDKKVTQKQFATLQKNAFQKAEEAKKTGRSFSEELAEKKQASKLPEFPFHKAEQRTISVDQANKLAHYAPIIKSAAARHGVPLELICGVILHESGGNHRAVSPAGAKGLMQLMPQTARRFGVSNSFDPAQNIEGGTKYLRWLLDHFKGNVELTLAGYNAGEQSVAKHGMRVPPFSETQKYVPSVLGYCRAMIEMLRQPTTPHAVAVREKIT